jgi:hypothetical protein
MRFLFAIRHVTLPSGQANAPCRTRLADGGRGSATLPRQLRRLVVGGCWTVALACALQASAQSSWDAADDGSSPAAPLDEPTLDERYFPAASIEEPVEEPYLDEQTLAAAPRDQPLGAGPLVDDRLLADPPVDDPSGLATGRPDAHRLLHDPSGETLQALALGPAAEQADAGGRHWRVDPLVQPACHGEGCSCHDPLGACSSGGTQPISWISGPYLRAGVATAVGGDILRDHGAGFTIAGGFRQPFGPAFNQRAFLDVGGSYLSAYGTSTRITDGRQTDRIAGNVIDVTPVADAFATTLREVKRGSVHAALGWYWGDCLDERSQDPQWRLATRLGGRAGHVRGRFHDEQLVPDPVNPPTVSTIDTAYGRTDTFGGLFVGAEAVLLDRSTCCGHVAWLIDGELGSDWMQFDNWGSGSLGTASIALGFMLTR